MIAPPKSKFKITHTTVYSYSEAVPACLNEVHLVPRNHARQRCITSRLIIKPGPIPVDHRMDYFGNETGFFSVQEAHQRLTITAVSKVHLWERAAPDAAATEAWEDVRDKLPADLTAEGLDAYQFTYDSVYIKASEELAAMARGCFTPRRPILEGALALTEFIHREFKYDPTATSLSTPISDVLRLKAGVCQDFAHLQIGMLRSLGLAARYVSGYLQTIPPPGKPRLVGCDASHAWLSVWCPPLGWIDLDPTNNQLPNTQHVTLAWGRDYDDVCPIKGVFIGGGRHGMSVSVDVLPLEIAPEKLTEQASTPTPDDTRGVSSEENSDNVL